MYSQQLIKINKTSTTTLDKIDYLRIIHVHKLAVLLYIDLV